MTALANSLPFFELAHRNFETSALQMQEIKKFYRLAGFTLCLKFAGSSLVDFLTPALQHAEVEEAQECDATICIWDSASTQIAPMQFPWPDNSYALRGNVIGYDNERIRVAFDPQMDILQMFDRERNLALYWMKDRRAVPWWIGTSPLLFILHWWMSSREVQLTHAAVIGYPEGGALLAGKSGSGKSTTSLACMRAGMQYVSEDYCLLNDLRAHTLYSSAKVDERTLGLFPEIRAYVENPESMKGGKAYFFHHQFQPEKILSSCPLKALINLKISDGKDSRLESIHPNDAVAALSVTTLWQLSHTGPAAFHRLKKVAEGLPCYRLHLGSDLTQAPHLIGEIL